MTSVNDRLITRMRVASATCADTLNPLELFATKLLHILAFYFAMRLTQVGKTYDSKQISLIFQSITE